MVLCCHVSFLIELRLVIHVVQKRAVTNADRLVLLRGHEILTRLVIGAHFRKLERWDLVGSRLVLSAGREACARVHRRSIRVQISLVSQVRPVLGATKRVLKCSYLFALSLRVLRIFVFVR